MLIILQDGWGYMLVIPLLRLFVHVILLLHLLTLLFQRGLISPGQAACPELCDAVCLLPSAGHKICQHDRHSLFCPAKIIGNPVGGDALCLVPGGIIRQDAPFKYKAARRTKIGPFLIGDPKLCHWHNCTKVDCVPVVVAILLGLHGGLWYGHTGRPYELVPGIECGSTHHHIV